jgi:hypothetical protein
MDDDHLAIATLDYPDLQRLPSGIGPDHHRQFSDVVHSNRISQRVKDLSVGETVPAGAAGDDRLFHYSPR